VAVAKTHGKPLDEDELKALSTASDEELTRRCLTTGIPPAVLAIIYNTVHRNLNIDIDATLSQQKMRTKGGKNELVAAVVDLLKG
jgi:hypothetical protein